MSETAKLALPLLAAAQAQKHVTHNEALVRLDTLVQLSVLDRDLSEPPGDPEDGDSYIVADGASGAWSGWEDRVARRQDGDWISLIPATGWLAWVIDEDALYRFDGDDWTVAAVGDVQGPSEATDNHLVLFDGSSGKLLKDDGLLVEVGTWTPDLSPLTEGDWDFDYTEQRGAYWRVGPLVALQFDIQGTPTFSTADGMLRIQNRPFSVDFSTGFIGMAGALYRFNNIGFRGSDTFVIAGMHTQGINFQSGGSDGTLNAIRAQELTSGENIRITGSFVYGTNS